MVGPVPIHVWGLMLALGIVTALIIANRLAKTRQLNADRVLDLMFWIIIAALVGGRLLYVASEFAYYSTAPFDIMKIWEGGMSLSGGFLGAFATGWVLLRRYELPRLKTIDALVFTLPFGTFLGRLGCFFIFDHPGKPTNFFLGQTYVDGIVRHNHGLYLAIDAFLLAVVFAVLNARRPKRSPGLYAVLYLLWYGIVRFLLDFLRATDLPLSDPRYAGLTVAQYISLAMVVGGLVLWYTLKQKTRQHSHATT